MSPKTRFLVAAALLIIGLLIVTGLKTLDRGTWLMEVTPVLIGLPVLAWTYKRFPLTSLLYSLMVLHAVVLIVGGLYTYAKVPIGFWLQQSLSLNRNPYDKIGHLLQGFVPVLIAREIFIRGRYVSGTKMTLLLSICVVMTISAIYELIEWAAAMALGQGADQFLGTQGDPWDTQSDMLMALIGATVALVTLCRLQDKQIGEIEQGRVSPVKPSLVDH